MTVWFVLSPIRWMMPIRLHPNKDKRFVPQPKRSSRTSNHLIFQVTEALITTLPRWQFVGALHTQHQFLAKQIQVCKYEAQQDHYSQRRMAHSVPLSRFTSSALRG